MDHVQLRRHEAARAPAHRARVIPRPGAADRGGPARILRLQAVAGNRAVAQLLAAGTAVQRCGGDPDCGCVHDDHDGAGQGSEGWPVQRQAPTGAPAPAAGRHDLTSPRFADDPILEACFDDKARLGVGARGPAVTKVQQALVDLDADLGPSGVDGAYGPATAAAVRKFKADQKLGFETFGDVGPGTMDRLDQLFGPGPTPPGPTPPGPTPPGPLPHDPFVRDSRSSRVIGGEAAFCPSPSEIDVVLGGQPSLAAALVGTGPTPTTTGTCPRAAGTHPDIATAVACFTSQVDVVSPVALHNVATGGQFFPYYELRGAVETELIRMETANPADADVRSFVAAARRTKVLIHDHQDLKVELDAMRAIVARTSSPEKAAMAKLIGPAQRALVVEGVIWSGIERTDRVPSLTSFASLNTLHELHESVCHECGAHANRAARRVKGKGGIVAPTRGVPPLALSLVAGPALRDRRPVPFPSGDRHLGDVVSQKGVAAAVAAMKKALDAGQMIHARVLSGVGYGTVPSVPPDRRARPVRLTTAPPEEHSLLVIGWDSNEFVFNDPDAGASGKHGRGFGALHFNPATGRLSTAAVQGAFFVTATGDQPSGEHRYQVLTLTTV